MIYKSLNTRLISLSFIFKRTAIVLLTLCTNTVSQFWFELYAFVNSVITSVIYDWKNFKFVHSKNVSFYSNDQHMCHTHRRGEKANRLKPLFLSKLNLSKFAELGHFSNFDKWSPISIESVPGPLERIIMHFWPKVATQEASDCPMNDPLPTQKNDQKNFFDQKWSKWVW